MMAITTSSQKEALPLAGRLSPLGTRYAWSLSKLDICSRLAGGIGIAHHGTRKGYSDFMQYTGPIMSWQSHQDANMQLAYNSLKMFQAPNMAADQTLCRRNSHVQISCVRLTYEHRNPLTSLDCPELEQLAKPLIHLNCRVSRELANSLIKRNYNESLESDAVQTISTFTVGRSWINPLILPQTCNAVSRQSKLGDSLSLRVLTKATNSLTPGMQKERGRIANPTLWDGCLSSHEENQQSTVLGDVRNPDLAYGNFRSATLLYEQNHEPTDLQDNHTEIIWEAYETFVGQPSASDFALRRLSSSRATLTSCRISSPAFVPIFSTQASASSEDNRGFSLLSSAWRRTISPRAAVTKNPAVDSPLNFAASISSKTSCGIRIDICLDLSLRVFVAMWEPINCICDSVYTKRNHIKRLLCDSVLCNLNHTLSTGSEQIRHKNGEARRCDNTNGPLTTSDNQRIEVAMSDHTTHPQGRDSLSRNKFTWRFLALSRTDRKAKPCRLSVVAHSEREARQVLAPHFILSLAARLPATVEEISMEVTHVA